MPWWPWRGGQTGGGPATRSSRRAEAAVSVGVPHPRVPEGASAAPPGVPADLSTLESLPVSGAPAVPVAPVTLPRITDTLDLLDIRYLADGEGGLLAMWERHAVLFTLEGPEDEILVIRARPHGTVPPDWADHAYRAVNEWNHTRRFCKAYIGDPTERGQLPIYAEMQVPLRSGTHDALLVELVDCAAAVATTFVDWLHDEGALL
ncbi:MAG TPA: YbjN domain-containing protein [Micromonosporaceae bacterium]|nr:YbjN domain-containing protein [Micromonosporaceae bacterium]